jgi:hypothetical protein
MNLSGKVVDSTGAPITGANVYTSDAAGKPMWGIAVNGGTGDDGTFKLEVPDTAKYIGISYVGMKPVTVAVTTAEDTKGMQNTFTLEDSAAMSEVTVTATRLPKPTPWLQYLLIGGGVALSLYGIYLAVKKYKLI